MSIETSPPEDALIAERPLHSGERLNRRQWRNKLKNKKKNRNKFKVVPGTVVGKTEGRGRSTDGDAGAEDSVVWEESRGKLNGAMSGEGKYRSDRGEKVPGGSAQKRHVPKKKVRASGDAAGDRAPPQGTPPHVTPRERSRLKKLKMMMQREAGEKAKTPSEEDPAANLNDCEQAEADNSEAARDPSAELRARMEQRLTAARFRYINQQLYTSDSQDALNLFQRDPEAFTIYHSGFSQQVQRWPVNPITEIIKYIKNRPSSLVVADFGCGDALLARSVRNKVHSFDLVALNDHVTVCDIAKVPLLDGSVDVAVFCLSLMGKNLGDFLQEANRVLKLGGVLLVAEVSSRFEDVRQFVSAMSQLGFKSINKNTENTYFFLFEFSKTGRARDAAKHSGLELKPCLYKKR
ncbi:ribosomal RNA-processing protein 8 isoform X2 [Rhinoderma darwinii]